MGVDLGPAPGHDVYGHLDLIEALVVFAEQHGSDPVSHRVYASVGPDGTPRDKGTRTWPSTERIKGWIALNEDGRPAGEQVAQSIGYLMRTHLAASAVPGTWTEYFDAAGSPRREVCPRRHCTTCRSPLLRRCAGRPSLIPSAVAPTVRQAVFLVGGKGTRLGDLTRATPKPPLEAAPLRFLDVAIEEAARHGFMDVLLVAGHLGDQVEDAYQGRSIRAQVWVIREPEPQGTGGAVRMAADLLDPGSCC
ncbi:MAG: sugar phosphate nucleotidyltransferase [Hyphomonas sp.]